MVWPEPRAALALKVRKESKEFKARPAVLALKVHKASQERRVVLARRDHKDFKEFKEFREFREFKASPDRPAV